MALFGRESARDRQREQAYREWFSRQHPLAVASAALSIFSLTHFGTLFVDEFAGIALGVIAIRQFRTSPDRSVKLAYVGVAVGIVSLIVGVTVYLLPRQ
jgi:hypothetical protein